MWYKDQNWGAANVNVITFIKSYDLESECMKNKEKCVYDPNQPDKEDTSNDIRVLWSIIYYSFTSLSTVGFGDFNPKSDFERLICMFILMFGVAIFSYIMGNFIQIVEQVRAFN